MGKPIKQIKEEIKNLDYENKALKFLNLTGTTFKAEFLKYDTHFEGETEKRDIYDITLTRGDREYIFKFGNSINASGYGFINEYLPNNSKTKVVKIDEKTYKKYRASVNYTGTKWLNEEFKEPTAYDVLACLTKSDP